MKRCYSKKIMDRDYIILGVMLIILVVLICLGKDATWWAAVVTAWIAQLAVSTGAYFSKAKAENRIKLPILLLKDLPEDMRERVDPTELITAVIGME